MSVFFVLFAIAVVGAIGYGFYTEKRNRELGAKVAAAAGLQFEARRTGPPDYDFDLFDKGSGRSRRLTMRHPDTGESVFRYQYKTSSGDNNTKTWRFTCVMVRLPFRAPHMTIGPEGFWSNLGQIVGIRDIEVESPQFNDRFRVGSNDERFAITLLDQPMIARLLADDAVAANRLRFEFLDDALLVVADEQKIETMPDMLTWATGFKSNLPTVLNDLYPIGR